MSRGHVRATLAGEALAWGGWLLAVAAIVAGAAALTVGVVRAAGGAA